MKYATNGTILQKAMTRPIKQERYITITKYANNYKKPGKAIINTSNASLLWIKCSCRRLVQAKEQEGAIAEM